MEMTEKSQLPIKRESRSELLQQLSTLRVRYNSERFRWDTERHNLLRVIFQLSEALEYRKHH